MRKQIKALLASALLSLMLTNAPELAQAAEPCGCAETSHSQHKQQSLAWTEWKLDSPTYDGLQKAPMLLFSGTQVHASVGLNSLFGPYQTDAQSITVQPLASTKMAGPKEIMQAENQYIQDLQGVKSYTLSENGNRLTMQGARTLTFHAVKNAPAMSNVLAGTKWTLTSPRFTGLESDPVLSFTNNRLNASVGLNSIFGDYTVAGKGIAVKPLASTRMAGPKPVMDAENRYIKALQNAQSFEISADGSQLTLRGDQTLTFRSTNNPQNNPLARTEWSLTSPSYKGLKDAPILRFSSNTLSASVGLNAISGGYSIDGQRISIESMISTMMAGPKPIMDAERAYVDALQSVRSYKISSDGEHLTMQGDQKLTFRLTQHT